ncbi:nuclear envelope protein [Terfezia claveryi]|nr:nuclear envelope protein [Terfezia claveryi]KAF8449989.1 nuclear envelope protein [Terfezia claveryi]
MAHLGFTDIAAEFVRYYYQTFDGNMEGLRPLYRPHSMLTFETNEVCGEDNIMKTLMNLPLGKVEHKVSTTNAQPSGIDGRILVLVTGHLAIEDSKHPQGFSQCFHLIPDGGTYYVLNDIFKLTYPA